MMRRLAIVLGLGFALWGAVLASAKADGWAVADMNRTIDQTNFQVNDGCSGTLISVKDRFILTANHCVTDQYEDVDRETIGDGGIIKHEKVRRLRDGTVTQQTYESADSILSTVYKVRVVAVSSKYDLALLQIKAKSIPSTMAAKLACQDPVRGESVYVVGNPRFRFYASVAKGIVGSIDRDYDALPFGESEQAKEPLMQLSAIVVGGNSGGSVFNDRGQMIGVPVLTSKEVIGFAVPLASIRTFLHDNSADQECEK